MKSIITITYEGDFHLEVDKDTTTINCASKTISFDSNRRYILTIPNNATVNVDMKTSNENTTQHITFNDVTLKIDNKKQMEKIAEDIVANIKQSLGVPNKS